MTRPRASQTFAANDEEMLWLGLVARDTGIPASRHLGIEDEVRALDFNRAVTLRLLFYDNERELANRKFWVKLVTGEDIGDDILNSPIIDKDPYSDANTQVW